MSLIHALNEITISPGPARNGITVLDNPIHWLILQTLSQDNRQPDISAFAALKQAGWAAFTHEAIRLRMAHSVDAGLRRHPELMNIVPEQCQAQLKHVQRRTLLINLHRQARLRQMLDALAAEGIPCLLMKGLWIVEMLYGNLAARESGDIDLLFKPEDMPRFTRMAQRLRYGVNLTIADIREIAAGNHEFSLPCPDQTATFDIHWSLTHPHHETPVDEAAIWARAQSYHVAGRSCLSLDKEDHLLLICFHAVNHHQFRHVGLRALVDIGQAITHPSCRIEWEVFWQRAIAMGWDRGAALIFELVRDVLGLPLPKPANTTWCATDDVRLRDLALQALIEDQNPSLCIKPEVVKLLNQESFMGWLRQLYHRLFVSENLIKGYFGLPVGQLLSRPALFVLHMRRWRSLVLNNAPTLLALWRGDPARRAELRRATRLQEWLKGDGHRI